MAAILPALPPTKELLYVSDLSERLGAAHASILDWIRVGVRSESGRRVRLHAIKIGGRWVTSHAWLERFVDECNDTADIPVA